MNKRIKKKQSKLQRLIALEVSRQLNKPWEHSTDLSLNHYYESVELERQIKDIEALKSNSKDSLKVFQS